MNKNKKEYQKPSFVIVPLKSHGRLLTVSTLSTHDAKNPQTADEEEIINSGEIL